MQNRKRLIAIVVAVVLVLGLCVTIPIVVLGNKRGGGGDSTSSCSVPNELEKLYEDMQETFRLSESSEVKKSSTSMLRSRSSSLENLPFNDYGCFYHDQEDKKSFLELELSSSSETTSADSLAKECYDLCDTNHFAITSLKCFCYVKAPARRISMGTCALITKNTCLDSEMMIDAYMKINTSDNCSQENTRDVRNFFVEEDDAPFSYDIVSNTYRSSPFDLSKDECGTNIYEVQTEVSEGSSSLTTTSKTVNEHAESSREHISSSIQASASFGFESFFAKIKAEVSASADRELNLLMKSSGAQSSRSRVYTSFIVKRLSEIKILDFDNKMNFVTFNEQFANLLRKYRDSAYDISVAKEIFDRYGMFIVERGLFGGYRQIRATAKATAISNYGSSESDYKSCYELSVEAEAKAFGASVSGSTDVAGCSKEAKEDMNSLQDQYSEEVSTESLNGGHTEFKENGDAIFVVDPDDSILLTDVDHYPVGDAGIQLRPITEFLSSSKISPLEVRRHLITETHFDEIKNHLEKHIIEILDELYGILQECKSTNVLCLLSFLSDDKETCSCYEGHDNEGNDYICLNPASESYDNHQRISTINEGSLVKIECSAQNEQVQTLLNVEGAWIGVNDVSQEGMFKYEDGSDVTYKNFAPGQPDNHALNFWQEDCVEMKNSGLWNDRSCTDKRRAVYQVASPISGFTCIPYSACNQ